DAMPPNVVVRRTVPRSSSTVTLHGFAAGQNPGSESGERGNGSSHASWRSWRSNARPASHMLMRRLSVPDAGPLVVRLVLLDPHAAAVDTARVHTTRFL